MTTAAQLHRREHHCGHAEGVKQARITPRNLCLLCNCARSMQASTIALKIGVGQADAFGQTARAARVHDDREIVGREGRGHGGQFRFGIIGAKAFGARSMTLRLALATFAASCGIVMTVSMPLSAITCAISRSPSRKLIGTTALRARRVP